MTTEQEPNTPHSSDMAINALLLKFSLDGVRKKAEEDTLDPVSVQQTIEKPDASFERFLI